MKHVWSLLILLACLAVPGMAVAANVTLSWNASASASVAGYYVYFGTTSGSYASKLDAGNSTSLTVSNLTAGVTYYFAATAYDTAGDQSSYSGEVSFIVPGVLTLTSASGTGSPALIQFPVVPGSWYEVQATTDLKNWATIWQTSVAVSNIWMQFADSDAASFPSRFYRLVSH